MLEEKFQSFLQGVREEARKQAIEEACRQAHEAARRRLVRQLEKRFGALEAAVLERIATADEAALDGYADRVLDAASVGDVIGE